MDQVAAVAIEVDDGRILKRETENRGIDAGIAIAAYPKDDGGVSIQNRGRGHRGTAF